MKHAIRDEAGALLIEVSVAITVLAITLSSFLVSSLSATRANLDAEQRSAAVMLAQDKMEELRNVGYAALAAGTELNLDAEGSVNAGFFDRSWTVAADSPVAGTSTVSVTVSWETGWAHDVTLESVFAE